MSSVQIKRVVVQAEERISEITEETTVIVLTIHHVGIVTRNIETMIE
jgi:hypothetical protein